MEVLGILVSILVGILYVLIGTILLLLGLGQFLLEREWPPLAMVVIGGLLVVAPFRVAAILLNPLAAFILLGAIASVATFLGRLAPPDSPEA